MRTDDRQTFVRLANKRVPNAVKAISLVGNLANRSNYSYNDADAAKVLKTLEQALADCRERFSQKSAKDGGFSLE
jgi:hypothetical protein